MFVRAAALRVALEEPQDRKAGPALQGRNFLFFLASIFRLL
jgi:hypothetical protein